MKKGHLHFVLSALLLAGLGLSVASCKDDDNDNDAQRQEQQEQEAQQQAASAWDVVSQLTSADNYSANWQEQQFEPTIGEPQEGNATVRIVATNDMASAAQRFASLVGLNDDFDLGTATYEWKADGVGTLNYRKTDNGQSWAIVDVNIRQLPGLQQIIYQSASQGGTNASFDGTAYYRFGDVVSRLNEDGKKEYWICVRPAFGPESKGDSHWVTLSPLPKKNVEHIEKYGRDFYVPMGLGKNEEQMQNLAEMLYAMMYPEAWHDNVKSFSPPSLFYSYGLRMFHDFSHDEEKLKYHNINFWTRVRHAWEMNGLFKLIFGFGTDDANFERIFDPLSDNDHLHLLCSGYSWWSKSIGSIQNQLSLFQYTYSTELGHNAVTAHRNMHKVTKTEVKRDMTNLGFNINAEYTLSAPYLMKESFFGDQDPHYIIRHATGKQLAEKGSNWDRKQQISGVEDVYVYNRFYYPSGSEGATKNENFRDLTLRDLEVTTNDNEQKTWNREAYNGDSFYLPGDVCIDEEGSRWFCLMNSGGYVKDANFNGPFSYFISFDNIFNSEGELAEDIATEKILPKVMLPILHFFHNYTQQQLNNFYGKFYENVKQHAQVDMLKMALMGDTIITVEGSGKTDLRPAICTTVAFPTADRRDWQLMRIVEDGAKDKTGNRQWFTSFYTKYENTNTPIMLRDIANQQKVNQFAPDRWAVLPLHGQKQRRSCRTQADQRATDISNYIWTNGQQPTDATSMWNEPVLVFRVAKVYDRGSHVATATTSGKQFKHYAFMSMRSDPIVSETARSWWQANSGGAFLKGSMSMNGEAYRWPDWNND